MQIFYEIEISEENLPTLHYIFHNLLAFYVDF